MGMMMAITSKIHMNDGYGQVCVCVHVLARTCECASMQACEHACMPARVRVCVCVQ